MIAKKFIKEASLDENFFIQPNKKKEIKYSVQNVWPLLRSTLNSYIYLVEKVQQFYNSKLKLQHLKMPLKASCLYNKIGTMSMNISP